MFKKYVNIMIILFLACFLAAGCSLDNFTDSRQRAGVENNQLIFAIWSAPDGVFNFNLITSYYDEHCVWPVFDSLLGFNPDSTYYSNLSQEWEIKEDGLTFYYKLRDDIYWHDGVPVTTEDVKFTFEWMMHPDYTGSSTSYWENIKGFEAYNKGETDDVEGIVILNEREIEFNFEQVSAPAHFNISTWKISPSHIFKETPVAERDNHPAILNPIGSGPFKFERYQEGQYVELVKNKIYHLGAPKLDRIIIKVANPDAAQAELLTGGVDAALIIPNADDYKLYKEAGLTIQDYPGNFYQYMGLQNRHELFNDRRVRQALTLAVDRYSIVDGLLDGMGIVQPGPISSVSWAFNENIRPYPYDPDRAKELLTQAGWVPGPDGILEKDGRKFQFTLTYPTGDKVRMDSALIIQQNLKDIGIEVEPDLLDFPALTSKVADNRDFDAVLMAWDMPLDPDGLDLWGPDSYFNFINFEHPDNLRLLQEGRSVVQQEERKKIYDEWQELIYEECPYVFLYANYDAYVHNSDLKEFKPNSFSIWYNVIDWHFK